MARFNGHGSGRGAGVAVGANDGTSVGSSGWAGVKVTSCTSEPRRLRTELRTTAPVGKGVGVGVGVLLIARNVMRGAATSALLQPFLKRSRSITVKRVATSCMEPQRPPPTADDVRMLGAAGKIEIPSSGPIRFAVFKLDSEQCQVDFSNRPMLNV